MASLTVFNITVLAVGAAFGSALCVALVMLSKRRRNGLVSTTQTKRVPANQRGLMANAVSPVQAADVTLYTGRWMEHVASEDDKDVTRGRLRV